MNKYTSIIAIFLVALSFSLTVISDADAKRFGGGSSFGGRSSYSAPYKRSVTPPARSPSQQQAAAQNQAARQGMTNRGGLMGLLGGLAIGGLLGSLFFGGGFEGFNFMDFLVLGGIALLLYKLFATKAGSKQSAAYQHTADNVEQPQPNYQDSTGFNTDVLFDKDKNLSSSHVQDSTISIPKGFDQEAFLSGAKAAFTQLQRYWDDVDLAEIRGLTTDKVFAEIQDQLKAATAKNHTDILKLDAELLEVRELGSELEAVVLFDAVMREDIDAQAGQVREVWHFIKPKTAIQTKWYLDGIQQLED